MEHICIYSCSFTPQLFLIANVAECLLFSLNENCLENLIGAGEYYQEVQEGEEEEEGVEGGGGGRGGGGGAHPP